MIEVPRFALVIGSQCNTQRELSFLPDLADELYGVLTDPGLGACASALGTEKALLRDPTCEQVVKALERAFAIANEAGEPEGSSSMLLVAMLGHGVAEGNDFYFLAKDATGRPRSREAVHLSQHLKELLRDHSNLNGLIVWLDSCQSGVAAKEAVVKWGQVGLGKEVRRYEVLTAADQRPAYRGDFTRTLIKTLRKGVQTAGQTIDANDLRASLQELPEQQPQRVTVDGGGWYFEGDSGLWISYNTALRSVADDTAGTIAIANASDLTNFLQPTTTLEDLVAASKSAPLVVLTGPRGAGKSTTAAALAKPAAAPRHVPTGFAHAIAFGRPDTRGLEIAATLAGQLRTSVDGFARAVSEFDRSLDPVERGELPALDRRVLGPLGLLRLSNPVRLVIDAFDEVPAETQETLRTSISKTLDRSLRGGTDIRFVLTGSPGPNFPAGAVEVQFDDPGTRAIKSYFRQRGISDAELPALVEIAEGNWLHARLIADLVVRRPAFGSNYLSSGLVPTLTKLYDGELEAAGAGDPHVWRTMLRPVLGVCAAAGVGPVLPLPISKAAAVQFGMPPGARSTDFRDALVSLSGLVVRSQPGQSTERVGVFHGSLIKEYLTRPEAKYGIDLADAHHAIVTAIRDLAPADQHDPDSELHQYAMVAEPDQLWASEEYEAVVDSLLNRPLQRAVDERERWEHWTTRLKEMLGPEHEATVTARENLARWSGEAGDPKSARDQLMEVLPIRQRISPPNDRKTLTTQGRLAYFTAKVGDLVDARDRYRKLLGIYLEAFGDEDLSTLETWMNYARFTGEAGDPRVARSELENLLTLCRDRYSEVFARTVAIAENLARFKGEAGDPCGARDQYQRVLPLRENISGPNDPDTLITRSNLAYFTGEAGDPAAARDQYRTLLPLRVEVGKDHPDTLTTRTNLARFVGEAGDPVGARDELVDVLAVRKEVSGRDHPDTLTTGEILARFTAQLGDPVTAQLDLINLYPLRARISGAEHPDTIATRTNLACFTGMVAIANCAHQSPAPLTTLPHGPYPATTGQCAVSPVIEAPENVGGEPVFLQKRGLSAPEHPDTLTIRAPLVHMNALAQSSSTAPPLSKTELASMKDALGSTCEQLRELLKERDRVSGEDHTDTLTTWENLAYFIGMAGDPAAARDQLAMVLPARTRVSGPEHPDTLTTRGNVAYFTGMAGDLQAARQQLEELLEIRERSSGANHPDTASIPKHLGALEDRV